MRFAFQGLRALLCIVCALLAVSLFASDAHAQSNSCRALQSQLASASRGANKAQFQRFDRAYKNQTSELNKARRLQRRHCDSGDRSSQCRQLARTIRDMRANLGTLKSQRDRAAGRSLSANQRKRLQAKIARACKPVQSRSSKVTVVAKRGAARPQAIQRPRGAGIQIVPKSLSSGFVSGGYRTMCVRVSDGYYFPISFSVGEASFKRDEAICAAMCPAAETALYVYKADGEQETETMTSLKGEPYTDLRTAFAYRFGKAKTSNAEACGVVDTDKLANLGWAQKSADDMTTTGEDGDADTKPVGKTLIPQTRVHRWADPETAFNAQNALTLDAATALANARRVGESVEIANTRPGVRVVLPEFLPAPEEATNLQAQGPIAVQ